MPMRLMTKVDAVKELIADARRDRSSIASLKRIHKALISLELTDAEVIEVEKALEYRRPSGELYSYYVEETKMKGAQSGQQNQTRAK